MALKPLAYEGFTEVPGFEFSGMHCGIKKSPDKLDLGLIFSTHPDTHMAGLFTINRVQAPCVVIGKEIRAGHKARAILVNSGCANAYTGEKGMQDARDLSAHLADHLKVSPQLIVPSSTGVIGQFLPVEKMKAAFGALVAQKSAAGFGDVAKAICTTDTFVKIFGKEIVIAGKPIRILGMAKGAGMIQPNMATMLAYIVTDAAIAPTALQHALVAAAAQTFNAISVDGEMSTNDTLVALANGAAQNPLISPSGPEFENFKTGLTEVCDFLARQIVRDGEGVTKFVELIVEGLPHEETLRNIAFAIANSYLVRTAIAGEDANWGRILSAAGACAARANLDVNFDHGSIFFNDVAVLKKGVAQGKDAEQKAAAFMKQGEFSLRVILGSSPTRVRLYTGDLTAEYVAINANYRT